MLEFISSWFWFLVVMLAIFGLAKLVSEQQNLKREHEEEERKRRREAGLPEDKEEYEHLLRRDYEEYLKKEKEQERE